MPDYQMEARSAPFFLSRADGDDDGLTLAGYAAVFDNVTRIYERGREFNEQIAKGAFSKAINNRDRVVMQFDHGQHPLIGSMPLGKITSLEEDNRGLYVEARLTDNWLIQPVRDAIHDGAVDGMSFRFSVEEDEWDTDGDMPLRTIRSVRLAELGPVVYPAYTDTTVAVRSAFHAVNDDLRQALLAAATPDEGQPSETPDEGHRRTRTQRRAVVALNLKEKADG